MAKNTGKGHRVGAVGNRSEFKRNGTWSKRDTSSRIMNGSPQQHKGVRNEKLPLSRTAVGRRRPLFPQQWT